MPARLHALRNLIKRQHSKVEVIADPMLHLVSSLQFQSRESEFAHVVLLANAACAIATGSQRASIVLELHGHAPCDIAHSWVWSTQDRHPNSTLPVFLRTDGHTK